MMRRTELGASTKVFFRVMSHPVKWARTVTANTQKTETLPHLSERNTSTNHSWEQKWSWKRKKVRLTWQGKKGENPEWDHAQLSETIVHSNYINQDLLWHIRTPKHHKAKLCRKRTKTKLIYPPLCLISSLSRGASDRTRAPLKLLQNKRASEHMMDGVIVPRRRFRSTCNITVAISKQLPCERSINSVKQDSKLIWTWIIHRFVSNCKNSFSARRTWTSIRGALL